jgi:hypothetical protein
MIFSGNYGLAAALCVLAAIGATSLEAQTTATSAPPQIERIVVSDGVPLRVILTERLRFKMNRPVHARIGLPPQPKPLASKSNPGNVRSSMRLERRARWTG